MTFVERLLKQCRKLFSASVSKLDFAVTIFVNSIFALRTKLNEAALLRLRRVIG